MFDKEKIEELFPEAGDLMFSPMLMWSLPKGKEVKLEKMLENGEYFASIKKDGAAYIYTKTENHAYLFGRTVSKVTGLLTEKSANVPHIIEALDKLPPRTAIVFEIYYPGGTSKNTTSIMGCLPDKAIKRQKDNPIHAYAHDIIYYDGEDLREVGAWERYTKLDEVWRKYNLSQYDFLECAQAITENIMEAAQEALANGEEGIVMRKKDGAWEAGKRPAWRTVKIKEHDSIDLVCAGFCEPTKIYDGKEIETWPYWENKTSLERSHTGEPDGDWIPITKPYYYGWPGSIKIGAYDDEGNLKVLGTVSSGLSDADKEDMFEHPERWLEQTVALECMSIDHTAKTLRHPAFVALRSDKPAKECKISEVFKS